MRTLAIWTCALLVAVACSPMNRSSGATVELTVDRAVYSPGDSITLTLANRSNAAIGYNLCPAALEARRAGAWTEAGSLAEVCTMELRVLTQGGSATYRHRLPAPLAAGEYRVLVNVESPMGGGMGGVRSGAFQVR